MRPCVIYFLIVDFTLLCLPLQGRHYIFGLFVCNSDRPKEKKMVFRRKTKPWNLVFLQKFWLSLKCKDLFIFFKKINLFSVVYFNIMKKLKKLMCFNITCVHIWRQCVQFRSLQTCVGYSTQISMTRTFYVLFQSARSTIVDLESLAGSVSLQQRWRPSRRRFLVQKSMKMARFDEKFNRN